MKKKILIVEDERVVRRAVSLACEGAGYAVLEAATVAQALQRIGSETPHLMILDLRLPDLSGLELCRQLRQQGSRLPIIMLTAKTDEVDKIIGLEVGADDYVTKPFSPRELVARIGAVLRRTEQAPSECDVVVFGPVALSHSRREVTVHGRSVHLTRTEFEILSQLARQPGRVLWRNELVNLVWGYEGEGSSRLLDVHIRRLREKLEEDASSPHYILTVRDIGYKLAIQ